MPRKSYKFHYLYKITNVINNKYYIGIHSTNNLNDGYFGSGVKIRNSVRYYGKESHIKEVLEYFEDRESLVNREIEIVNIDLIDDPLCMNVMRGGGLINEKHMKQFSEKGGKAFKEKLTNDPEFNKQFSMMQSDKMKDLHKNGKIKYDTFTGKKHKSETIEKMKESQKGKHEGKRNSQFGTIWITNGTENRKIKKDDMIPENWKRGRK